MPGVTAASEASAELGISLTRRGLARKVAFVTPRAGVDQPENDWAASVLAADTSVIYMGAGLAEAIVEALIGRGLHPATPVAVVENASLPGSRILRGSLAELPLLAKALGAGPAVILLGEVLRESATRAAALPDDLRALLKRA